MTEYELVDAIATYSSNTGSFMAIYLTVVSGFLITAFVAGARLSLLQATILSVGFVVAAFISTYGTYGAGITQVYYTELLREIAENSPQRNQVWVMNSLCLMMLGGIVASLVFMWSVRHPKTN